MVNQQDIDAMVHTIVQEAQPVRIILFGSYAANKATEDSDIDLCIIEKDAFHPQRSRRKEAAKLYKALAAYPIPKDLLIFSEAELHQEANQHLLKPIQEKGKVLYESA